MHNLTQLLNEKRKLAFPSTQDKTATFHQDHNLTCFSRSLHVACLSLPGAISPKAQTITCHWSDWPSRCDGVLSKWSEMYSLSGFLLTDVTPASQRAAQAVAGSQGHCRLVLCGGWRLHRLNWTLCNYRMPLILHCFKDRLLLTLLNTCTGFKKETIPQRSAVRFILKPILLQVCLTTMAAMERVNTWDVVGLHAKFHQYQSGLYFDNILLLTLLKDKHHLSHPRLP